MKKKKVTLFTRGRVYSKSATGLSKQLKQIFHIEHNIVKNANWQEANQLAIYKRCRGFELGATEKQIQVVVTAGLEPGTTGSRVRHADHSATLPKEEKMGLFFQQFYFNFQGNWSRKCVKCGDLFMPSRVRWSVL